MALVNHGILAPTEEDIKRCLAAEVHLGTKNCTHAMSDYMAGRLIDKEEKVVHVLDLEKFWDKLILAARVIVAVEDPSDVCVISARPSGKRAVIKYAHYTHASQLPDRFTPGTFTNQIQERVFMEPRLLVLTDPLTDHQALKEASYVNIPVIALCNSDSDLQYVDVAIPCNNRAKGSIALVYWLLARTVMRMRGWIGATEEWNVAVDLFYHRDPEELEDLPQEEEDAGWEDDAAMLNQAQMGMMQQAAVTDGAAVAEVGQMPDWGAGAGAETGDWADEQYAQNWSAEQEPAMATPGGPDQYVAPEQMGQPMGQPMYQEAQYQQMDYGNQPLPEVGTHQAFPEVDTEQW